MNKVVYCTIVTRNRLAYARTLADSLLEHNPGGKLFVLLVDQKNERFDDSIEHFTALRIEDLSEQDCIARMSFYYSAFEFCNALKGLLLDYLFNQATFEKVIYLDSDIMVCSSFQKIIDKLNLASILLIPHSFLPVEKLTDFLPYEIELLRRGLYNAGFIGIQKTETSQVFMKWFKERLQFYAFDNLKEGMYVDQLWLNLVPLYFKNVAFLSDPGANLGHWNLSGRKLTKNDKGDIVVNGEPISFVHFSNWNPMEPHRIVNWKSIYDEQPQVLWGELACSYARRLFDNGYEKTISIPYAFDYFSDGSVIAKEMRRLYYEDIVYRKKAYQFSPFENSLYFKLRLFKKKLRGLFFRV